MRFAPGSPPGLLRNGHSRVGRGRDGRCIWVTGRASEAAIPRKGYPHASRPRCHHHDGEHGGSDRAGGKAGLAVAAGLVRRGKVKIAGSGREAGFHPLPL